MRVLLIEDDREAARVAAKGLQEEGFVVDHLAPTGEDGEEQTAVNEYDVIVVYWLPWPDTAPSPCGNTNAGDLASCSPARALKVAFRNSSSRAPHTQTAPK